VLITHSSPIFGVTLLGGDTAVTCFYVISGFLITLILHEKYQDLKAFYINRGLRIYVPYWTALVLSVILFLLIRSPSHDPDLQYARAFDAGDLLLLLWATISNLTLVGIDLIRYVVIEPTQSIVFPSFVHGVAGNGHNVLFVPQAWTLAIELQFYLVAPFLVRLRVSVLAVLTVVLLALQITITGRMHAEGLVFDNTAIFVLDLVYFLFGALAYHGYRTWRAAGIRESRKRWISGIMLIVGIVMVFAGAGVLRTLPNDDYNYFYLGMAVVLPFAFYLTKDSKWDSRVGDYSYLIYVFHFGVSALLVAVGITLSSLGLWVLIVTVAISTVFLRYVDAPLQRVRRRIAARSPKPELTVA
jgi:peptidoglycan/LPS O-acetylase OafA/YrhL